MVLGSEVVAEPHNLYFSTLLRMGLVGMLALITLTGGLLHALWRIPTRGGGLLGPGLVPALLTMQVIWFITWLPGLEQWIITGLAGSWRPGGPGTSGLPPGRPVDDRETSAGARPSRPPAGDGADPAGTSISAEKGRDVRSRTVSGLRGGVDDHASQGGDFGASSAQGGTGRPLGGAERPASPPVSGRLVSAGR
jgi:hypothetical protein